MRKLLSLMAILGVVSCATAFAAPLQELHASKQVQCSACHPQGPQVAPTTQDCAACHGSYKEVAKATANLKPNPHDSHMGELDCVVCHKGHQQQTVFCNQCHTFKSLELK